MNRQFGMTRQLPLALQSSIRYERSPRQLEGFAIGETSPSDPFKNFEIVIVQIEAETKTKKFQLLVDHIFRYIQVQLQGPIIWCPLSTQR